MTGKKRPISGEEQAEALLAERRRNVRRLKKDVGSWNLWRVEKHKNERIYLIGANLNRMSLAGAHLTDIDLSDSNFDKADLTNATFFGAVIGESTFKNTTLIKATLDQALFTQCDLRESVFDGATMVLTHFLACDMSGASLKGVNFSCTVLDDVQLKGANLSGSRFQGTIFENVDLSHVVGLEYCLHDGPSVIDYLTLKRSGPLPLTFLRGVGLPETFIEYLPSLLDRAIQHYSCFISYSTKDQGFADRLHSDLQNKGVRCWFAPHDLNIGKKIWEEIDAAIRVRDKLFLILSEHSIDSEWVEDEVNKAFEEERKRGQVVLFPVRLDDAVMITDKGWAAKLRNRHIGDFRNWKNHDAYRKSFERVLRDLKLSPGGN